MQRWLFRSLASMRRLALLAPILRLPQLLLHRSSLLLAALTPVHLHSVGPSPSGHQRPVSTASESPSPPAMASGAQSSGAASIPPDASGTQFTAVSASAARSAMESSSAVNPPTKELPTSASSLSSLLTVCVDGRCSRRLTWAEIVLLVHAGRLEALGRLDFQLAEYAASQAAMRREYHSVVDRLREQRFGAPCRLLDGRKVCDFTGVEATAEGHVGCCGPAAVRVGGGGRWASDAGELVPERVRIRHRRVRVPPPAVERPLPRRRQSPLPTPPAAAPASGDLGSRFLHQPATPALHPGSAPRAHIQCISAGRSRTH